MHEYTTITFKYLIYLDEAKNIYTKKKDFISLHFKLHGTYPTAQDTQRYAKIYHLGFRTHPRWRQYAMTHGFNSLYLTQFLAVFLAGRLVLLRPLSFTAQTLCKLASKRRCTFAKIEVHVNGKESLHTYVLVCRAGKSHRCYVIFCVS